MYLSVLISVGHLAHSLQPGVAGRLFKKVPDVVPGGRWSLAKKTTLLSTSTGFYICASFLALCLPLALVRSIAVV